MVEPISWSCRKSPFLMVISIINHKWIINKWIINHKYGYDIWCFKWYKSAFPWLSSLPGVRPVLVSFHGFLRCDLRLGFAWQTRLTSDEPKNHGMFPWNPWGFPVTLW
jgi:hypothetical protein